MNRADPTPAEHPQTPHEHSFVLQQGATCRCGAMTEHPAAPTTEAGRTLEREIAGDYGEEIAGIEAEARAAARKEVIDLARLHFGDNAADILDSLSTDTREEPSDV